MKNILNAISAILIILFLGWMLCGDCCEKKCKKSDTKECDYSKCEKSGARKCEKSGATKCDYSKCDYSKCKSSKTKKECPHANKEESIITEEKVVDVEETKEDETIEEYNKRIADQPGNGTIYIRDGDTTFFEDSYMIEAIENKYTLVNKELSRSVSVSRAERTISDDGKVTYEILEE